MKKFKILFFILNVIITYAQTSDQIKEAKSLMKSQGISESQAKAMAKQRGYTDQQINDALNKNKKISETDNGRENIDIPNLQTRETSNNDNINIETMINKEQINEVLEIVDDSDLEIIKENDFSYESADFDITNTTRFFGYEIFKQDPALFQASSIGGVDPDYIIGPGDEIILMLWGETQFRQELTINREGFVFIPEIGQVFVNGLNLSLLESKLFRVLSQSYASLNPQNQKATTFLDVSIGNLRPLRIQVLGEVSQPGAYTVGHSSTLFSSLYYFNGPTILGTLRDIQLIRGDKKIASIDFYDYLLYGKKSKDQKLNLDDVIFIPKRMKTVSIQGEINRPGYYELKEGETLVDLIQIAGGLKTTAYLGRSQIDRIVPFEKRLELGTDRKLIDVNLDEVFNIKKTFFLEDQDKIQIFSVLDMRLNIASISGAITRPGRYDLGDSLYLSEIIKKADGVLGDAYLKRIDIVRSKSDFSTELIKLNLGEVLDERKDLKLVSLDEIKVYSTSEMINRGYASIEGHIKRPGLYELQDNMTLSDLIFKGGGYLDEQFKKQAYLNRAELIRSDGPGLDKKIILFNLEQVLNKDDIASMILFPNDKVRLYSLEEIEGSIKYVNLSGKVKKPGLYELYEDNMTIHDLIFKGAGLEDLDFRSEVYLEKADLIRKSEINIHRKIIPFPLSEVQSNKKSEYNYKLNPGDEIRIYDRDSFNRSKQVEIKGSVKNPGSYEYKNGMKINDLIIESGGINSDVFKYRIDITRIEPDSVSETQFAKVIVIEDIDGYKDQSSYNQIGSKLENEKQNQFLLLPYDIVNIRPDKYFNRNLDVQITGEVYYPGAYSLINDNENISSLIDRAGGLTANAFLEGSKLMRNNQYINIDLSKIKGRFGKRNDINLINGDVITIPSNPNLVSIVGEVNNPGFYKYSSNQRIKSLINQAGGLSTEAEDEDIYITFPSGISRKYSPLFRNHKLKDGSVIKVGKRKDQEEFDRTEYAKELTAIIANLAQAISILILARN